MRYMLKLGEPFDIIEVSVEIEEEGIIVRREHVVRNPYSGAYELYFEVSEADDSEKKVN
jgi:hypothetical protein